MPQRAQFPRQEGHHVLCLQRSTSEAKYFYRKEKQGSKLSLYLRIIIGTFETCPS